MFILRILRLTVLILALNNISFASETVGEKMPIASEIQLDIPLGEFSVIDFPFELKGLFTSSYVVIRSEAERLKILEEKKALAREEAKNSGSDKRGAKKSTMRESTAKNAGEVDTSNKAIDIQRGINNLTFFPRQNGQIELVVWGHDHPIMLTLKVSEKNGKKLYSFFNPDSKKTPATELESQPHEKVITLLIKYLHLNKTPPGYKIKAMQQEYQMAGMKISFGRAAVGSRYLAEEWFITNNNQQRVMLYEEQFYEVGTFAVAIENEKLEPGESTRIFLVRTNKEA